MFLFPRWRSFKRQMLNIRSHSDSKGFELKRANDSIYTFPCPDCMCRINKSEDSRSSATWSGCLDLDGQVALTLDFVSADPLFFHWNSFIFLPFPSGKKAHTSILGALRILFAAGIGSKRNSILLYMMLEGKSFHGFFTHTKLPRRYSRSSAFMQMLDLTTL